jgi:hypothetical protein
MQGMISSPEAALNFMLAGNAIVTLRSQKTGNHYTYKIRSFPNADPKQLTYKVLLLTGPDNENDYSWLGRIVNGQFYLTRRSREMGLTEMTPSVKAIIWVLINLSHNQMPAMLEILHEGRCGRCNKVLTVPESVLTGLGPICAAQD